MRRVTAFSNAPVITPAKVPPGANSNLLTDEGLAERMKPVTLTVGADGAAWELALAETNVASVAAARARERAGMRMRVDPSGKTTEGILMEPPPRAANQQLVGPFGLPLSAAETSSLDAFGLSEVANIDQSTPATGGVDGAKGAYDERRWVTPAQRYQWPHQAAVSLTVPGFSPDRPCCSRPATC